MRQTAIGAVGTRGDVRPAIALGQALARDRKVVLIAPPENRGAAERAGLRFLPLGEDFSGVVARGDLGYYRGQIGLQFSEYRSEYEGAAEIIGCSLFFAGSSLAEAFGSRCSQVFFSPQVFRSRLLMPPSSRRVRAPAFATALAWRRHEAQNDFILKRLVNEGRKSLGLAPLRGAEEARKPESAILALDPLFAELPADVAGVRQAHYWHMEENIEPDEICERFFGAGAAPILLTLGNVSRAVRDSLALLEGAAEALTASGARVVLVHPEAPEIPSARGAILEARALPFDSLLPRCSAIAHHGGIGTLFAAARAGIPQLALPCMLDQYFWAARIAELGLGRAEKGPKALAEKAFARRFISLASDEAIREKAAALSTRLLSEERARAVEARIAELFPA